MLCESCYKKDSSFVGIHKSSHRHRVCILADDDPDLDLSPALNKLLRQEVSFLRLVKRRAVPCEE